VLHVNVLLDYSDWQQIAKEKAIASCIRRKRLHTTVYKRRTDSRGFFFFRKSYEYQTLVYLPWWFRRLRDLPVKNKHQISMDNKRLMRVSSADTSQELMYMM